MICSELERAFKHCKNRDDAFKLGLVYFDEVILIGAKNNVVVNLDYLDLVEYMDSLSFAALRRSRGKVEGDDEGDEEEEKEVGGTKRVICVLSLMWVDDADVVIVKYLTIDTTDINDLKMQLNELKDISNRNLVKKVEELSNVVEELRRVVEELRRVVEEKLLKRNEKMKKKENMKRMKKHKMKKQNKRKEINKRKQKKTKVVKLAVGGLVGELATDEYEDVKGLDDDNIIVKQPI
ncbi:unnamed protein product [Malus baccata var. baccata]